jgi:hypothetical protein
LARHVILLRVRQMRKFLGDGPRWQDVPLPKKWMELA